MNLNIIRSPFARPRQINRGVVRHGWRILFQFWLSAVAFAAIAHAQDEACDAWIRGVFTGRSPRPQLVAESEAWRRAEEIVSTTSHTFTLVGGGESMRPLYPSGTILVLREVAFADLQSGQTVVYRNRALRAVAHVLVAKCRDGWRVRGLNNSRHDLDAVGADNLIGIVVAAFTPTTTGGAPHRIAAR